MCRSQQELGWVIRHTVLSSTSSLLSVCLRQLEQHSNYNHHQVHDVLQSIWSSFTLWSQQEVHLYQTGLISLVFFIVLLLESYLCLFWVSYQTHCHKNKQGNTSSSANNHFSFEGKQKHSMLLQYVTIHNRVKEEFKGRIRHLSCGCPVSVEGKCSPVKQQIPQCCYIDPDSWVFLLFFLHPAPSFDVTGM